MATRTLSSVVLVLTSLCLLILAPGATAQAPGRPTEPERAYLAGECLAWDISGEWRYQASGGGYGRMVLQQDVQGNVTGQYYNEASGGSGSFTEGKVTGASVYWKTQANELFRGSVNEDGKMMSGTYTSGSYNGTWQATGQARCSHEAPPPTAGSIDLKATWGTYIFRASYGGTATSAAAASRELAAWGAGQAAPEVIQQGATLAATSNAIFACRQVRFDVTAVLSGYQLHPLHVFVYEDVWVFEPPPPPPQIPIDPYKGRFEIGMLNPEPPGWNEPQLYSGPAITVDTYSSAVPADATEVHVISVRDPQDNYLGVFSISWSGLIDPSGYVYNAANNQRLEGATASCYVNKGGQWVLWDAAAYDQTNPQVTDPEGLYGWYVPEGDYQVRVSKPCYSDAQSASMHVPPPRTDVNLGMTPAGCSAVTVEDVWLANESAQPQQAYCAGARLEQHIQLDNSSQQDVSVQLAWTVTDPEGQPVAALSGSGTYSVPPFGTHVPLPGTIPETAKEGAYTLTASLTHQGQTSFRTTRFYVHGICAAHLPLVVKNKRVGPVGQWVTIKQEGFEGAFPGEWQVLDNLPGYGDYRWARRTCRAKTGSYSGWAVGGGANGAGLPCGSNYPDNAESWMLYGPFSLQGATAAELRYQLWLYSESDYDRIGRYASIDGGDFYGIVTSGNSNGWIERVLDLGNVPTLGNLLGQPQVWVALVFESDGDTNYAEGAYADDIVVRKYVSAAGEAPPPVASSGGAPLEEVDGLHETEVTIER